ncbi:MAG: polysaccharide pyruvyl transferase family protein [Ruminococcus sp.]|nr:polysaccharide pyruvyl transferase family protein [Ruminococcus sp.]
MKIGIVTITGTSNYGAALQIHALQRVMEGQGADCETISYDNPYITREHTAKGLFEKKGIKNKIRAVLLYSSYKKRMERFKEFERKYCRISSVTYNKENISQANFKYDCFVAGSDQVWNLEITHGDENYFLSFADEGKKLCSYAASTGSAALEMGEGSRNLKALERYSVISVREQPLSDFLVGELDAGSRSAVRTDIDPTLLLDSDYWKRFAGEKPCSGDYIFLYLFKKTPQTLAFVNELKNKYGCQVFYCAKGASSEKGFKRLTTLSPEEFLNYIYHAKFVITGSFHAACFSLQFEKELYMTEAPLSGRTTRLRSLAEELGVENRLFSGEMTEQPPVSYGEVKKRLAAMREKSMETIKLICQEKGGEKS